MPTIIGHHNITKGAKHWLTSPKRKELFAPLGVTNIRTLRRCRPRQPLMRWPLMA